ncbi:sulfite exporter TauE/SafE family protein [Methylobacterium goesingense]|uniref:Probable membrane transporter protein n=1 Tax=Methylobacterium goesingense TaxID=243690 RepID=A0ABV2LEP5_9HYPH|nr:sulfite exporter TauE/SafE family protein [Methylobacterium goesingense]GJD74687.1 putative membrane transporter protein YfcA [Methylobacterium goesingense]
MDWMTATLLIAAGVAGGVINAVAGGATLITFPVMLQVGLPPVIANASNAVAVMPGHLIAALADPGRWPPLNARLAWLAAASLFGGMSGALLLLWLPESLFTGPVPILIAFATLLFAFAPTIQARQTKRGPRPIAALSGPAMIGVASIYGGFFGAGLGVILTALLSISVSRDIRTVKVLKNLIATIVSVASTTVFITQGAISWPETFIMLLGALMGGFMGGCLIRFLPAEWVRRAVIAVGCLMSTIYGIKYWT